MHALRHAPLSLATVVLAGGLHLNGQEQPSGQPDSDYTTDQAQAMDRVDKLSALLLEMPRTPAVVNALSQLGHVACRHDRDLGIRVFEKAYAVSAGMAFELETESSLVLLSRLVSRASNCHPEFSNRSPTGREDSPRLPGSGTPERHLGGREDRPCRGCGLRTLCRGNRLRAGRPGTGKVCRGTDESKERAASRS